MPKDQPELEPGPVALGAPPSRATLFLSFLQIGLFGFGGVGVIGRHVIVEKRRWLNDRDYAALLGLCQALPGGNIVNVATILGDRFRGPLGSVIAVTGLFAMPLLLLTLIATAFDRVSDNPDVMAGAAGAAAAAAGMIFGLAIKLLRALAFSLVAYTFVVIAFVAVAFLKTSVIWTVAILLPLCVAATFWERHR
jgi:chromate transporter